MDLDLLRCENELRHEYEKVTGRSAMTIACAIDHRAEGMIPVKNVPTEAYFKWLEKYASNVRANPVWPNVPASDSEPAHEGRIRG